MPSEDNYVMKQEALEFFADSRNALKGLKVAKGNLVEKVDRTLILEHLKAFDRPIVGKDSIIKMADAIRYVGWDPVLSMSDFLIRNKNLSDKEYTAKILSSLIFFVVRGTNFEKEDLVSKSADPAMMTQILKDIQDLGIVRTTKDARVMTLSRLSACYPIQVCHILRIIKQDNAEFGLPGHFCFPHSPQIMTDAEWNANKKAYYAWSFALNKRINPNDKKKQNMDLETFTSQQESIVVAMRQGPFYDELCNGWRAQVVKILEIP